MNKTNFIHAAIALAMQASIWLWTGSLWLGALFAIGFYLGREHAQREYKIGDPSKLRGYEALDFWHWKRDAQFDLLFPVIAVLFVALC